MHVDIANGPTHQRLRRALQATGGAALCAAAVLAGGTGVAAADGLGGLDPTAHQPGVSIAGGQAGFDPTAHQPGVSIAGGQGGLDPTAHQPGVSIAGGQAGIDPTAR